MKRKKFKYIESLKLFNTLKVSVDKSNTSYSIGNSIAIFGIPQIFWKDICFIENEKLIWTHGCFYNNDKEGENNIDAFTDEEILEMMPSE